MIKMMIKEGQLNVGEGRISGYIACLLSGLSLLGVLAFHFPEYLTTPELRQNYSVAFIRQLMFVALVVSGSLGLINFIRNKNKRLGAVTWAFVLISIALGGNAVEVGDFSDNTPYIGLDWFILDLLGSTLIFTLSKNYFPIDLNKSYYGLSGMVI